MSMGCFDPTACKHSRCRRVNYFSSHSRTQNFRCLVFLGRWKLEIVTDAAISSLLPAKLLTFSHVPFPQALNAEEGGGRRRLALSSHPWPEWTQLMERLVQNGYVDDPDGLHSNSNRIRTACLMFSRDRFDLFKSLSKRDLQVILKSGCPSTDRKVVNSGKRLRAHLGIQEANVCSTCKLRGNCERAYATAHENEDGRTVDVMRVLLTYGLDMTIRTIDNKLHLSGNVEESSRKLLGEILTASAEELDSGGSGMIESTSLSGVASVSQPATEKQNSKGRSNATTREGDWICSKCDFLNFKRNIRCLGCDEISQEKLKKLREDREHLPLKRGDWICNMCNFFNFVKNTKCLQCNEKPSKRNLGPGEWECPSCYFVNFRRNTVCLKCNWKRPKASFSETNFADVRHDGNEGNREHSNVSLGNGNNASQRSSIQLRHQLRSDELDFWSSDEDQMEKNNSDIMTEFEDFLIAGGKSRLSQVPPDRQRLKGEKKNLEKLKDNKFNWKISSARSHPQGDQLVDSANCNSLDLDDDDDEISDWFRCRDEKNEKITCS